MRKIMLSTLATSSLAAALLSLTCSLTFSAEIEHQTLPLKLGGSEVVQIRDPSYKMKVLLSEPSVLSALPLSKDRVWFRGKKVGFSRVTIWDEKQGEGRAIIDVVVSLDLTALKAKINELYPEQKIEVYGSETGVVLSGAVTGPEIIEQVLRLTKTYLPKEAEESGGGEGTGRSGGAITNLLKVSEIQQVMLEVKFAEVSRESSRDWQAALGIGKLGSDFTGAIGTNGVLTNLDVEDFPTILGDGTRGVSTAESAVSGLIQNPSSLLVNFAGNAANAFINIDNVTTALTFLEGEGLARLLAEPRLTTQSGQEASFLAGGEFPFPITDEEGNVNVEFKEFGVGLIFTPVVLSDGKISLRVAPSVSSLTDTAAIALTIAGANVNIIPSLNTRKLETTVQLYDGQTLALAGLLQDNLQEEVSKVPGLGDIPILGALFRSTSYLQEKTDLLITVTPHLVKPVKEGSISYPGEFIQNPNRLEFYLEGRLEGRRGADAPSAFWEHGFSASTMGTKGGLEGNFGHQPVISKE